MKTDIQIAQEAEMLHISCLLYTSQGGCCLRLKGCTNNCGQVGPADIRQYCGKQFHGKGRVR